MQWAAAPLRLLLEGSKRAPVVLFERLLDTRRAESADELVLEIGDADLESLDACELEHVLLALVAQPEDAGAGVAREEAPDRVRATHVDDRHVDPAPSRQRLERELVADPFDEHDRVHACIVATRRVSRRSHTSAAKDIWRARERAATVAPMTALVLAEPEASVRGFLEKQLTSDGFDVLAFEDPAHLPRAAEPDVVVLGDPDALDRCRLGDCPVIVLGRADAMARVRALEHCDDYLTRPFVYEELVARIRAVLRRRRPRADLVDVGEIVIDRAARRVVVQGRDVTLATKEYALLLRLAVEPDRVFTREQLLRDVWSYRTFVPTRTVESHASRVRCKLAAAGLPGWIVNVWGVGYKLRPSG